VDEIDDKPTFTYFNHYRSINSLIDSISLRTILFLQNNGFNAYSVAASQSIPTASVPYSGVFSHKAAAVSAGLGWIGKSALFIHNEFGPRVRLGTVLTDMPLPSGTTVMDSKCSACNKCVSACPAMAIRGGEWSPGVQRESLLDAKACSEYMSSKFKHIGRGSVCGICMRVCPNKKR
jgi:epoxyqueuosine reductase QueG